MNPPKDYPLPDTTTSTIDLLNTEFWRGFRVGMVVAGIVVLGIGLTVI